LVQEHEKSGRGRRDSGQVPIQEQEKLLGWQVEDARCFRGRRQGQRTGAEVVFQGAQLMKFVKVSTVMD
jgi:hypothetical protein